MLADIQTNAETISKLWSEFSNAKTDDEQQKLIENKGAELIKSSNTYISLIEKMGLKGPFG